MSDTPKTDKYCGKDLWIGEPALVSSDFARELERECNHWEDRALTAERERDEARAALQRITESDMRWSKKIARDALENAK